MVYPEPVRRHLMDCSQLPRRDFRPGASACIVPPYLVKDAQFRRNRARSGRTGRRYRQGHGSAEGILSGVPIIATSTNLDEFRGQHHHREFHGPRIIADQLAKANWQWRSWASAPSGTGIAARWQLARIPTGARALRAPRLTTLEFIVPGDPQQRTGGYLYDARIVSELRQQQWTVNVTGLEGQFPLVDDVACKAMSTVLERQPDQTRVVIDGLALGNLPDPIGPHAKRLDITALVASPAGR